MKGPHKAGDVIGGRYSVKRFVGEGGMQFVYCADDNILSREVALKCPKNPSAEKRFQRSAIVAARVNHPNVAKTFDYLETSDGPYLVEELVNGADLDGALLKTMVCIDPYTVARVFHYLARGLAASHHAGVIHRDLKPTNVLVEGDAQVSAIKITDFGIAKMADEELAAAALGGGASIAASQTAVGALPYMAPEAIETPKKVSFPADVWSAGAMMYELLSGETPFGSGLAAVKKIVDVDLAAPPTFVTSNPQFSPLSTALLDLIRRCLQKNPADRPTADQLVTSCGLLCYPTAEKFRGVVKSVMYDSWGFIGGMSSDVFFHLESVYGPKVSVGDQVLYSKFSGGGAPRAHPVVALKSAPPALDIDVPF